MSEGSQTPIQEAVSLITIVSIMLAVACYLAAVNNVPVASPALFWVACRVYDWFPGLVALKSPQVPHLVAAAAVGCAFFVVAVPFSGMLAAWFSSSAIASMERQTVRLKRNRARIKKKRDEHDEFTAS